MDLLGLSRLFIFITSITFFSSCAKLSYLYEQGVGQAQIILEARDNEEVLNDSNIPDDFKKKIRNISEYKKYFYEYWHLPSTDIYDETNILNRDAVTYLVIASKKREIKPLKNCFFIVGCFPYLGFFKLKSAKRHVKELSEKGYDTYLRKVLAYSTLGNLDDPILSTFFKYSKYDLAETIFHELFHTIFFVKGEVDLNENLANYVGKEMLELYFKDESLKIAKHNTREKKYKALKQEIVTHAKTLKKILESENWMKKKNEFLTKTFPASIQEKCDELELQSCWPLKIEWNNAVFSAFMTYEKSQNDIEKLASKFKDLRSFLLFINTKHEEYQKSKNEEISFEEYLFI